MWEKNKGDTQENNKNKINAIQAPKKLIKSTSMEMLG